MPNLLDIQRRIRSVKNTQQITRAMKMVAAAKLRRSQDRILATRPYALELRNVASKLASGSGESRHPLLESRDENKVLLIVVTGDRGLAGAFNTQVLREAQKSLGRWESLDLLLLGKKGVDYFKRRETPIRASYPGLFANVEYSQAAEIAQDVAAAFTDGTYDAVYVIYNEFKSVISQKLNVERLLPLEAVADETEAATDGGVSDYLFEPSAEVVLAELLPRFVDFQLYRVLLESQAAEHAARMTAMDSATKNASELIEKLTLTFNRARQAAITTELIEVVSGANALEG